MQKILTPLIFAVFFRENSAFRHLCRLSAILGLIIVVAECGMCADEPQYPRAGTTIAVKEDNPSGVSINVKDETRFSEPISGITVQAAVPKVILKVDSALEKSAASNVFHTVQGKEKSNSGEKPDVTLIAPVRSSAAKIDVVRIQSSNTPTLPGSASTAETSQTRIEEATQEPRPFVGRISLEVPARVLEPASQTAAAAIIDSSPAEAARIAIPEAPRVAALPPAPQNIIVQEPPPPAAMRPAAQAAFQDAPLPAPAWEPISTITLAPLSLPPPPSLPEMAMASQDRRNEGENRKDNTGQTNQGPVAPPGSQLLPPPPSVEGPSPQAENATPSTPSGAPAVPSDQKLGEAPPDNRLEFLREQTILLKPGEWQWDIGFTYVHFDSTFPEIVLPNQLVEGHLRQRLIYMPLAVRYGLNDNVQLFASAPVGWAGLEVSTEGADDFFNNGGIGDTSAGATFLVQKSDGRSCCPDILATFAFTAPTGRTNGLVGILESPGTSLGQGFWAGYWNVLVVHTYDPVIVFYGVGSRHFFTQDIMGIPAKPGDQYSYQLGTGFGINERITFSTTFIGYYITEASVYNRFVEGTTLEPLSLRFAVTITQPCKRIVEPSVIIGLTDAAANAQVGITWTF